MRGRRRDEPDRRCRACATPVPARARWCPRCGALLDLAGPDPATSAEVPDPDPGPLGPHGARRRRAARLGLLAVLAVVAGVVARPGEPPPPPPAGHVARGDAARSGVVATTAPAVPDGVAWEHTVALSPLLRPDTILLADRRRLVALVPLRAGALLAVHDAAGGRLLRAQQLRPDLSALPPLLHDGRLVLRGPAGTTVLDLRDEGRDRDAGRDLDAVDALPHVAWNVPEVEGPRLATTAGGLVALDPGSGEVVVRRLDDGVERWRGTVEPPPGPGALTTALAAHDDLVVVLRGRPGLQVVDALDATDGSLRWRAVLDVGERVVVDPTPLLALDGDALSVVGGVRMVVLDADDGTVVLDQDTPTTFATSAARDAGATVVTSGGGRVLGRSDAGARWISPPEGGTATAVAPVATATDRGVVVQRPGRLELFASESGDVLARSDLDTAAVGAPAPDGRVPRGAADGSVMLAAPGEPGGWAAATALPPWPEVVADAGSVALTAPAGVRVLDAADGRLRWAQELFDPDRLPRADELSPPALVGDLVAATAPTTAPPARLGLVGLEAATGLQRWARRGDVPPVSGTPTLDRDLVLATVGGRIHGFEPATGRRALVLDTVLPRGPLAAADGWLAAARPPDGGDGDVWVGRRTDRTTSFRAPEPACAPPTLVAGRVVFPTLRGAVVARELDDGSQPWGRLLGGDACVPLSVLGDDLVAVRDGTELVGLDVATGGVRWRAAVPGGVAAPPVVAGGLLLVATLDGRLSAWRAGGDEPVWQVPLDGVAATSPTVTDGTVLVLLRDGRLVALAAAATASP